MAARRGSGTHLAMTMVPTPLGFSTTRRTMHCQSSGPNSTDGLHWSSATERSTGRARPMTSADTYSNPFAQYNANKIPPADLLRLWCDPFFGRASAGITPEEVFTHRQPIVFAG